MRAVAALLAVVVTLAIVGTVAAAPRERLQLQIAADGTVVETLRATLEPRLSVHDVAVDVTAAGAIDVERLLATAPEADPDSPLARVWLDGRDPQAAVLFLIPRMADRVLARRVPLKAGFDDVAVAEIAYILERAVASLRAAEPVGVPRAEARAAVAAVSPPAPTPAPPAPRAPPAVAVISPAVNPPAAEARLAFDVGVFGGVTAWAPSAAAVLSAGVALGLERVGASSRFGLALMGQARRTFEVAASPAGVRVRGSDTRLLLTLGRQLGDWGIGRVGIGPALVIASVDPVAAGADAGQTVATPRTDVDLAVSALFRWDLPLGRFLTAFAAATVDVLPIRPEYTAIVNGADKTLLAPWPVRPGFLAGVAFAR